MAYNYGPPPGAYGMRQPQYGPPGGSNAPGMGMRPPPNYGAPPGMDAPPGMASQSPASVQSQFQPPPNLPNINFNAPVIRLGVDGQRPGPSPVDRDRGGRGAEGRGSNNEPLGNRNRMGLGAGDSGSSRNLERERQQLKENIMALQPPTREEVARTIFIGGLGEGAPSDDMLESLLRCAGKLRRWTRAKDADDRKCKFGFAEYEDVESLEAASEIYPDFEVPQFDKTGTIRKEAGDDSQVMKTKLLVVVDEQSMKYIDEWKGRRREDDDARQFRIDGCKEDLRQSLAGIIKAGSHQPNGTNGQRSDIDDDGDTTMGGDINGDSKGDGPEVVSISLSLEDELADIPAEMRATVAEEIKAFRDRSNRRDLERLRKEEEVEMAERQRNGTRAGRLASPPPSAPSGPASAANGVPVGPRNHVQGAPSGPKGYRGAQMPNDYSNGIAFVPGVGPDGRGVTVTLNREDEDAEESDEELERRREEKKNQESDSKYREAISRWETRERQRAAAQQREHDRELADQGKRQRAREKEAARLADWNDDEEARTMKEIYYSDRPIWLRHRAVERDREAQLDANDRQAEERERNEERRRAAEARGLADSFLDQMGSEMEAKAAEQANAGFGGFKISLGSAAAKKHGSSAPAPKRSMVDVESLLEDEEDAAASGMKRPELKPLQDTSTVPISGQDLTEEEKTAARQSLAQEIPHEKDDLFAYAIKWDSLSAALLDTQIRPFVERKVVEYLGVQEELLVDTVMDAIRDHKKPGDIASDLEPAMEDEAEMLVRKTWRLLVFLGESESRGLS